MNALTAPYNGLLSGPVFKEQVQEGILNVLNCYKLLTFIIK